MKLFMTVLQDSAEFGDAWSCRNTVNEEYDEDGFVTYGNDNEDGWWGVTLLKKRKDAGAPGFLVGSALYKTEHWAEEANLRPPWTFYGGHWEASKSNSLNRFR